MTEKDIQQLISRYQTGRADFQERLMLENWYARESHRQMQHPEMEDYARIQREMWSNLSGSMPVKRKTKRLWPVMAVAAAVLATIILGIVFLPLSRFSDKVQDTGLYVNDVSPGRYGATLSFSNGKVIALSEGRKSIVVDQKSLTYGDGTVLAESGTAALDKTLTLTASTANGQTYQLMLPDGTKVWLNAASSLKFPLLFSAKQRSVELVGEAYFQVARNTAQPFVVKSNLQEIKVLGTHFNVTAYPNEALSKTTLVEGSVQVLGNAGQQVRLEPGQQSILNASSMRIAKADTDNEIAWVKGDFVFKASTLEDIMQEVSRWYDVEINYAPGVDRHMVLGGIVSRSKNISAVLKMIELTKLVRFKVEGKTITVMP